MSDKLLENNNDFIIYTSDDGQVKIEVRLEDENDSNAEESAEKEEDIRPSYFEEVMYFTNKFSFFCKNSMVYAAERKKFQDLGNYNM